MRAHESARRLDAFMRSHALSCALVLLSEVFIIDLDLYSSKYMYSYTKFQVLKYIQSDEHNV